jgi:nucleotide-binding universal stress UspA family protein
MNVMMAVKGPEEASFFRRAMALSRLAEAERVLLVHVIDPAPHADLERGRERFLGKRPLSAGRNAELLQLEEERARSIVQVAHQALSAAGVPDDRIDEIIVRGKPNDELLRLAVEHEVELVVVHGRPGKMGPHSLGKTARFLIDHCPQAALLVR